MALITQSPKNPAISEKEQLVEQAKRRAQQDFSNEQVEATLKKAYEHELTRLRKGEAPPSQSAEPTSAPTTRKEGGMDTEKKIKELVTAYMSQGPTREPLKPVVPILPPSPEISEKDGALARQAVEVWGQCRQAQKDFPNLADFYEFVVASDAKNQQLPAHLREMAGLPFYKKLISP